MLNAMQRLLYVSLRLFGLYLTLGLFSLTRVLAVSTAPKPPQAYSVPIDRHLIYLFQRNAHHAHALAVSPGEPLLPHRVYFQYEYSRHIWVYVLTNEWGELSHPLEALRSMTVLEGRNLGAPLAHARYELNDRGQWAPTVSPLVVYTWMQGTPPLYKRYPAAYLQLGSP